MMLKIKNWIFGNRQVNPLSIPIGETREGLRGGMLDAVCNARDRIIVKGRSNRSVEAENEGDDPLSIHGDKKHEELRKSMLDEVRNIGDRIIAKGRFNNSAEVKHLQEEVMSIADDVLLGHATFEEFKAFCRRWEHKATL